MIGDHHPQNKVGLLAGHRAGCRSLSFGFYVYKPWAPKFFLCVCLLGSDGGTVFCPKNPFWEKNIIIFRDLFCCSCLGNHCVDVYATEGTGRLITPG